MEPRPSQPRSGGGSSGAGQGNAARPPGGAGPSSSRRDLGRPDRSTGAAGSGRPVDPRSAPVGARPPTPAGTGGGGWMPPTMPPPAVPPTSAAQPPAPTSPFAAPGPYSAPPAGASVNPYANPYTAAPSAVPPSEYGPIRDIYDPNFAAAYYGGTVPQDGPAPDVPAGRLTGLESRSSRRRRTILSGAATALAVFLVVGLIAFAVWQTQQGDDGRESARNTAGTPPPGAAGDQLPADADGADGEIAGDVTAGAPGAADDPTNVPTAVADDGPDDAITPGEDTEDPAADEDSAGDEEAAADDADVDAAEEDAADGEGADAAPTANPGGRSLANLVPAEDEVPDGFVLTNESRLDQDEVAANLGDPDAASAQLDAWGWRGHLQREFARSAEAPAEAGEPTYFVVSVHRFDSPESADEALAFFSELVIGAGFAVTEAEPLGDESILLVGASDEVTTVNVYVRTGPYLVRIVGGAPDGDPTADVVALAEVVLVNEPDAA